LKKKLLKESNEQLRQPVFILQPTPSIAAVWEFNAVSAL
jgi:hypothetical protein